MGFRSRASAPLLPRALALVLAPVFALAPAASGAVPAAASAIAESGFGAEAGSQPADPVPADSATSTSAATATATTSSTVTAAATAEDSAAAVELPESRTTARAREARPHEVKNEFIRRIPSARGDPVRAATYSPGVQIQNDVNVRPLVRGGDPGQTAVVLDGVPILHPYHVGGAFSVFNLGALESVEMYRGEVPVEYPGSLSGMVRLKSKRPSLDAIRLSSSLSMMRGDAFAEVPVIRNRLGVWAGAQGFLLNGTLHGLLDLTSRISDDSAFRQDVQRYHDHINLPGFRDYQWGMAHVSPGGAETRYSGSLSTDDYTVVVPKQINVIRTGPSVPVDDPIPIPPVVPKEEIARSRKFSVDSISSVDIGSQAHILGLRLDADDRNFLEADFAYQSRSQDVGFKKGAESARPLSLSHASEAFDVRLADAFAASRNHSFKAGASYGYRRQEYDADIPYVLYDVIVNGNMDMLEPLGLFADDGFTIAKEDTALSNFDYLADYPSRIRFAHRGRLDEHFAGVFLSHAWETPSGTLTTGIRGEYQSTSGEFFPAPRVDYRWRLDGRNQVLLSAGLYSQNDLPYYERDRNPSLKSEKSAQAGLEWTHAFSPGYKAVIANYYKRYFDLVVPSLGPDRTIDLDALMLPRPGTGRTPEEIQALRETIKSAGDFSSLPDSVREAAYDVFGGLAFDYANTGTGHSLGSEIAFHYRPFPAWTGWLSADFSLSSRRDGDGRAAYPYRYHRPVSVNWVNAYSMPNRYEVSLTYRWAMGQGYTTYSGVMDGKGSLEPIEVGARNSGRLAPYSRLDLRLARNSEWKGA